MVCCDCAGRLCRRRSLAHECGGLNDVSRLEKRFLPDAFSLRGPGGPLVAARPLFDGPPWDWTGGEDSLICLAAALFRGRGMIYAIDKLIAQEWARGYGTLQISETLNCSESYVYNRLPRGVRLVRAA